MDKKKKNDKQVIIEQLERDYGSNMNEIKVHTA